MELNEKMKYEFQCFYLDQMRTSKENIFAHSEEIEVKKKLLKELILLSETLDQKKKEILILQPNLLESAYSFWKDVGAEDAGDVCLVVKKWVVFVTKRSCQMERQQA